MKKCHKIDFYFLGLYIKIIKWPKSFKILIIGGKDES